MLELVQKLHTEITTWYTKALFKMKQMYIAEMVRLALETKALNSLSNQMTSSCEFANKACDMSNPTQLLAFQKQIMTRLHELENTALIHTASDKTDFSFTDRHVMSLKQIQTSLQTFCEVEWSKDQQIDPLRTTVQFAQHHEPLDSYKATVQTFDIRGQFMKIGGAMIKATQNVVKPFEQLQIEDNNDGTYSVSYLFYLTPSRNVISITKTIAREPISNLLKQLVN